MANTQDFEQPVDPYEDEKNPFSQPITDGYVDHERNGVHDLTPGSQASSSSSATIVFVVLIVIVLLLGIGLIGVSF